MSGILEKFMTWASGKTTLPLQSTQQQGFQASTGNFSQMTGDTRQSGGKTRHGLSNYRKELILNHWALRQNTRYASHDSIQARTILKRSNDSVIGNGLKLDPTPDSKTLGITREEAEAWSEDVKNRFDLWAKSKKSDLTGRNNFYQNQRFYGWQFDRDGDVFVRFTYSKGKSLLNPLQISFIDPNQIRGDEFTFSSGPKTQDDGIIKDKNGKETAYKVWISEPNKVGRYKIIEIPAIEKRTRRILMVHGFNPEWAGQTRGIPEIAHALQEFEDITSFELATIRKAINGANKDFIVENDLQDPSDLGTSAMDSGRAGPPIETIETISESGVQNLGVSGVTSCNLPEQTTTENGITIFGASQGDKLKAVPSNSPSEHSPEFVDHKFGYLSASVSLPKSMGKMEFSKSHSASRAELGLYADVKEIKKDDYASDFLDPTYEMWLSGEIGAGRVKAPGFSDPLLRQAWLCKSWTSKPLPDVDPLKTLQAKQLALKLGFTDFDKEAILYNGSSGKSNRAKLKTQTQELETNPFDAKEETEPEDTKKEEKDNG